MYTLPKDEHQIKVLLRKRFGEHPKAVYAKGETIYGPLERPHFVALIETGFLKMYDITHDGKTNLLAIFKPGDIVPLAWAVDGKNIESYYDAMGGVTVRQMPHAAFIEAIEQDTAFNQAILRQVVTNLRIHSNMIKCLQFRTARERLIARLIFMARRFGRVQNDVIIIEVPISQQDIADTLNMTRETASRELLHLAQKGFIRFHYHEITVIRFDDLLAEIS